MRCWITIYSLIRQASYPHLCVSWRDACFHQSAGLLRGRFPTADISKLSDKIKPIVKSRNRVASALPHLTSCRSLYNGKSLVEDGQFALEVTASISTIRSNEFKNEDGNLYAIYGTPAESLCGLQVKQFRKKYGIIEGVSDREYVCNSFPLPCNGGHYTDSEAGS